MGGGATAVTIDDRSNRAAREAGGRRRAVRLDDGSTIRRVDTGIDVRSRLDVGTRVEVRARFDQRWARGFEIAEVVTPPDVGELRYLVRRRSDGSVLPARFSEDELREEKRRDDLWWV